MSHARKMLIEGKLTHSWNSIHTTDHHRMWTTPRGPRKNVIQYTYRYVPGTCTARDKSVAVDALRGHVASFR